MRKLRNLDGEAVEARQSFVDVDDLAAIRDALDGRRIRVGLRLDRGVAGAQHILPGGSITLSSGILAQQPIPGSAAISLVNAGLEGFARAAALELQSAKVRVNVVSPP